MKPKIVVVSTMRPQTHVARYLTRHLLEYFDVEVVCERGTDPVPFPVVRESWVPGRPFVAGILRAVSAGNAQAIHIHHEFNMYGGIRGAFEFLVLLRRMRSMRKPILTTLHAVIAPSQVDARFCRTFNLPGFSAAVAAARLAFGYFFRRVVQLSDYVHVHSLEAKQILVDRYGGRSEKIFHVPLGVPETRNDLNTPAAPWVTNLSRQTLVCFGYLVPRRGIHVLLRAFDAIKDACPDATLLIAGGSLPGYEAYALHLEELASASAHRDSIVFTGMLTSENDIAFCHQTASVAILPYIESISSSAPLAFAIAYGCPIVASDVASLREIVAPYHCGVLVHPNAPAEISDSVIAILTDPEKAAQLRLASEQAREALSWRAVAERLAAVIRGIIPAANSIRT